MFFSFLYVLLSGIALPVGGIQMQYLWRNQLGDVYSLGLGWICPAAVGLALGIVLHITRKSKKEV